MCQKFSSNGPGKYTPPQLVLKYIFSSVRLTPQWNHHHIGAHCFFATLYHLPHLRGQSLYKVFQPSRHLHLFFPDTLDGSVKSGAVAIVVFADRKEALEVIAGLVETEC